MVKMQMEGEETGEEKRKNTHTKEARIKTGTQASNGTLEKQLDVCNIQVMFM